MTPAVLMDWRSAFEAGAQTVGGKAWNLARLDRFGFQVPRGGVLAAAWCRAYVAAHGTSFHQPLPDDLERALLADLDALGLSGCPLAVRSSALAEDSDQASFAGIHESVLNVRSTSQLIDAIRRCWASAYSPRAASYRQRLGIEGDPSPAIVLMAMAPAESAGVAFSCDPRTGREDRVFVSSNLGLGETVVGGTADPDEFIIDVGFHGPDMTIAERRIGRKERVSLPAAGGGTEQVPRSPSASPSLADEALLRLARLVVRIKDALGHGESHQDVEWVWDGADFWLVQARPVTTRPTYTYEALRSEPTLWSNGNIRDSLPMFVRPLVWSLSAHSVQAILESFHRATGYPFLPGLTRFRQHHGRGYLNMSVMQWEFLEGMGFPKEQTNRVVGGHQRTIAAVAPRRLRHRLGRLGANLRLARALGPARKKADQIFAEIRVMAEDMRRRDWSDVPDRDLVEEIRRLLRLYADQDDLHLLQSASAATFNVLALLLNRFCKGNGDRLAQALLIDQAAITSAEQGIRLAELARLAASDPEARATLRRQPIEPAGWRDLPASSPFREAFTRFLDEFGHRSVYELDICNARWREDQSWLLETIAAMLENDAYADLAARRRKTVDEAWGTIGKAVPRPLHGLIRRLARQSAIEGGHREMAKSSLVRVSEVLRLIINEIARHLAARGVLADAADVAFLTFEDLQDLMEGRWDGRGARCLIADRRAYEDALAAAPPPDVFEDGTPLHAKPAPQVLDGKTVLSGLGVAAGQADGTARIILSPTQGARLAQGDILVAPSTDPGWTPLFLRAGALVTETGGFISHGAIVAREYGIPAVVNVPGVLSALPDGRRTTVDGNAGRVLYEP